MAWTLDRCEAAHGQFNCLTGAPWREDAMAGAAASAKRYASGAPLGPLDGVPVLAKANFCVKGKETTCASEVAQGAQWLCRPAAS